MLILMGVSGSGKSTVARLLARRLGWPFKEGDELHPESNIQKMKAGQPLTDVDRGRWLAAVAEWVQGRLDVAENGLITCSALKRSYRDAINRRGSGVVFVFLAGSTEVIRARLAARRRHFMPSSCSRASSRTSRSPHRTSRTSGWMSARRRARSRGTSCASSDWAKTRISADGSWPRC